MSQEWNRSTHVASLKQIHSDVCLHTDSAEGRVGAGDALITDAVGARVGVRTADCVPILLVDTRKRAVAAVHAGWRGSASEIARRAVAAMAARFGTRCEDLVAAIGPAIGACCYEVGAEVAVQFRDWLPARSSAPSAMHLDLPEMNRRQLLAAGVDSDRIWLADLCTCCSDDRFFSWRGEHQRTGRMLNAVGIRAK